MKKYRITITIKDDEVYEALLDVLTGLVNAAPDIAKMKWQSRLMSVPGNLSPGKSIAAVSCIQSEERAHTRP